ncbi:hypothetical protein F8388_018222, partial [Cannabis sativa]
VTISPLSNQTRPKQNQKKKKNEPKFHARNGVGPRESDGEDCVESAAGVINKFIGGINGRDLPRCGPWFVDWIS